jgi:hypothetical protein
MPDFVNIVPELTPQIMLYFYIVSVIDNINSKEMYNGCRCREGPVILLAGRNFSPILLGE